MTNPPWSIARRLSSLLTLALTALWLVAVAVAVLVVSHETNEVFDSALQETAQRLVPLVIDDFGEDDAEPLVIEAEHGFAHHEEYLVYQVRDARGRVLLRSHDAPEAPFRPPCSAVTTKRTAGVSSPNAISPPISTSRSASPSPTAARRCMRPWRGSSRRSPFWCRWRAW